MGLPGAHGRGPRRARQTACPRRCTAPMSAAWWRRAMGEHGRPERRLPTGRLVLCAIALGLLVLFIAQNFLTVEIRFIVGRVQTRLAWALIIAAILGFLA